MRAHSGRQAGDGLRTAALLAVLGLALALSGAARGAETLELLANGGFEALNSEGGPENWGTRDWGDSTHAASRLTGGARFGQRCLELRGTSSPVLYACFSHPVSLDTVSSGQLLLSLSYRAEAGVMPELVLVTFAEDFTAKEWATPVLSSETVPLETSPKQWQTVTWHVRLLPAARQAVVMLQIRGRGGLFVDGVSLKAYPTEVQCELISPGIVVNAKGGREARLRLTNRTAETLPVRIGLQVRTTKGSGKPSRTNVRLAPGKPQDVTIGYSYPLDKSALLALTLSNEQEDVIYDEVSDAIPGLIEGRIVSPAFRATILPGIPTPELVAEGSLNATPELRRQLKLDGRLAGLGQDLPDIALDEEGRWRVRQPLGQMLTGAYAVHLRALQGGNPIAEFDLPLTKPEPRPGVAGYDERLRLVLGEQRRLPLGIFMALDEGDLASVAEAGFNTVVLPSRVASTDMMETAQKLGLAAIVSSANTERDFWQTQMQRHAGEPNLIGWYVLQRPETEAPPAPPALMDAVYGMVAELDPRHPVCLAVGSLSRLEHYSSFCDILMPWTEPEPPGDLRAVDVLLTRAQELCAHRRPIWPLIQITGAAYATDSRLDPKGNGRPPTADEYRCMAYQSLARGANGLFSFAYRVAASRTQLDYLAPRDAPDLWQGVKRVNQELRALTPVLLEGEPVAVRCDNPQVAVRGFRYHDACYVLAANPLSVAAPLKLSVPGMKTALLEVAFDTRKVQGVAAGEFADQLEPHGVRVYMGR